MKYLITSILIFVTANCFAMDQKLIDGADKYRAAVENLKKVELQLSSAKKQPEYWAKQMNEDISPSPYMVQFYVDKINASNQRMQELGVEYNKAKEDVIKLEPIKKEYDKQAEIEFKRSKLKTAILNISGMLGLPLAFLLGLLFVFRWMIKRNKRLLKEGKLTPEDFKKMMLSGKSSLFSDDRINPATGFPISGGGVTDAGGNISGSSSDRYYRYDRY